MPMHPRERLPYSPIEGRPPLKLPKGVRLVIWPVLALEEWDMARPMARMVISPPQGQPMLPDHPNWSWHEYGMRVGFWRLRKMMRAARSITPTVTLNARVCETYPPVVKACLDSGWELNAHGYDQVPMHKLDDQRARHQEVDGYHREILRQAAARLVRPGPDADLRHARLPFGSRCRIYRRLGARRRACDAETTHKPIVALPYNFEIHDIVMMALQSHPSDEWHGRALDHFEGLYAESAERAEIHGDRLPSVSFGRAAPHRPCRAHLRGDPVAAGVVGWDGEQDPRLVPDRRRMRDAA